MDNGKYAEKTLMKFGKSRFAGNKSALQRRNTVIFTVRIPTNTYAGAAPTANQPLDTTDPRMKETKSEMTALQRQMITPTQRQKAANHNKEKANGEKNHHSAEKLK